VTCGSIASTITGLPGAGSMAATTIGANSSVVAVKPSTITAASAAGNFSSSADHRCLHCGAPLAQRRKTKSFCRDACRKAAKRAVGYEQERRLVDLLRQRGLIGQVWPVYRWDSSPRVLALMVSRAVAVAELIMVDPNMTEDDLARALRRLHIADWKQPFEADLIEGRARRRRIEEAG
jgi:hypothetical protein